MVELKLRLPAEGPNRLCDSFHKFNLLAPEAPFIGAAVPVPNAGEITLFDLSVPPTDGLSLPLTRGVREFVGRGGAPDVCGRGLLGWSIPDHELDGHGLAAGHRDHPGSPTRHQEDGSGAAGAAEFRRVDG